MAKKNSKEKFFFSILGEEIGLLFQFADDFLDIRGSKKLVGKPIKKDNKKGKSTLINLMGYIDALSLTFLLEIPKTASPLIPLESELNKIGSLVRQSLWLS